MITQPLFIELHYSFAAMQKDSNSVSCLTFKQVFHQFLCKTIHYLIKMQCSHQIVTC